MKVWKEIRASVRSEFKKKRPERKEIWCDLSGLRELREEQSQKTPLSNIQY